MTDYKKIGSDLGALLEEKQAAYGDVFSATPIIVGLLFPNGIPVLAYRDLLTIVRVIDKLGRICTAAGKGDPMGEDPWRDIAGYAMLMLGRAEEKQRQDNLDTEAYLASHAPEPSDTVDDDHCAECGESGLHDWCAPEGDVPEKWFVWHGSSFGESVWCERRTESDAVAVVSDALRASYPYSEFWVANEAGKTTRRWPARGLVEAAQPSNDWALTWSDTNPDDSWGPRIESVFPTREQAEAKLAEMAAKQSRLTWRVCRVDEVGK